MRFKKNARRLCHDITKEETTDPDNKKMDLEEEITLLVKIITGTLLQMAIIILIEMFNLKIV